MTEKSARVYLQAISGGRSGSPTSPTPPMDGDDASAISGSHIALAEALTRVLGEDWKCASGKWLHWDDHRWKPEETKLVWYLSKQVCKHEGALLEDRNLAQKVHSSQTIMAAVQIASAEREVAANMNQFDRNPWLLNTPDGPIDLRSGQLVAHDRSYLMTKMAAAGPCGANGEPAECPEFLRYLREATGDDDALMRFLQRLAGYCLTGSIEEHCILFFHGPGGSGKSTFLLVLQDLLGDYAVNAPMNAFTVATGERHPTELAHFFGARVVTASEIEEGMRWDEGKLKSISGGDKITARYMRGDFFTFEPQFKLILAGNHRPRMRSADDAMRRRMQVIPFRHKPQTVDKNLREKLKSELGGILKWAVEGEIERQQLGGLNPPAVVTRATDAYFQDENTLGKWLDERCGLEKNYWTNTRTLYRDFKEWAQRVGEFVLSERVFSQKLELMPRIEKTQHPRTRLFGFQGLRPLHDTADLFEGGGAGASKGKTISGDLLVRANELPLEPASDPAEVWPR
jgi:putative DNA primase/helicase